MKNTTHQLDHTLIKKRSKEVMFASWLKSTPPRFYLNLIHDPGYQIPELFNLIKIRNEDGSTKSALYRGEVITVEEMNNLFNNNRVPTKVWVSGGKVHTDTHALPLSPKDETALLSLFNVWAAKAVDETEDIEFATAVLEEFKTVSERQAENA